MQGTMHQSRRLLAAASCAAAGLAGLGVAGERGIVHANPASHGTVGATKGLKLEQVQVCFRHGARTPYRQLDSTPEIDWPEHEVKDKLSLDLAKVKVFRRSDATGKVDPTPLTQEEIETIDLKLHHGGVLKGGAHPARLTKVGMEQAIGLGKQLRERYINTLPLVPKDWASAKESIFVRSTETERTIETAQGVLTGLFPEAVDGDDHPNIYLKTTEEDEWAVAHFEWCPRLNQLFKQSLRVLKIPTSDAAVKLLEELREHVKLALPQNAGAFSLSVYRDQLDCGQAHGKPAVEGVDKVDDALNRLKDLDTKQIMKIMSGGLPDTELEGTRLVAGRMVSRMIQSIENHASDDKKFILYSAHDWTIIMLMMAVDPEGSDPRSHKWPKFCSDLAFEVWTVADEPELGELVRIMLNGEPLELPSLRIGFRDATSGCTFYTFESLKEALDKFLLVEADLEKNCAKLEQ